MRILIAGASGFIGSAVARHLTSQGHTVARLVRHAPSADEVRWDPDAGTIDAAGLEDFEGVVQVASRPWPLRWSAAAKQRLRANRLATNGLLADALAGCAHKPRVFICASGMGFYPPAGDTVLTEDCPPGSDFLATLQRDGEAAALRAGAAGVRVVNLRIPAVLGGASLRRSPGRMGDGRQWSSWVARAELANIVLHVLSTEALAGPVNAASPQPVRNIEMVTTVSRVLGRRPGRPMPAWMLRLLLGEMADALILASRRLAPGRLLASGYRFCFPELEGALRHELSLNGN